MTQSRRVPRPRHRALMLAGLLTASTACENPPVTHRLETPAPPGSQLPGLITDTRGRPVLSWVEATDDGHRLMYAVRGDAGWQAAVKAAEGAGWFVNWADVPSVQPIGEDLWAAHWLVKQPGGAYSYDINLTLSRDGGRTWDSPFTPHRDQTPTEHGFVSLWPARLADGHIGVGAVWLDGRHTLIDPSRADGEDQRMTLRSAVFDAGGREVAAAEVDDRVCDCCPTDVAVTGAGPLVAYRDRTDQEVRDIHLARATPSGWRALGPAAEDGWVIRGCPVNGPAVAVDGNDVVVAWYTEAAGQRRVRMSRRRAADAGPGEAIDIDREDVLGRVDVAVLPGGAAVVSWLGAVDGGGASLLLARVDANGTVGAPLPVAEVEASRPTGFPRIVRHGDGVLVAWTQWRDGVSRVVTAWIPAADLPGATAG